MFYELKQAVLSLGQEFTPVEIRKPDGSFPPWVVEAGNPLFDTVAKLSVICLA